MHFDLSIMVKIIFLNEVLKEMRKVENGAAVPFSIKWRTFNSRNQLGGRLIGLSKAVLCMQSKPKTPTTAETSQPPKARKNPNHWDNRTRNIEKENGQVVKLNIDLITEFNGKQVVF